MKNEFVTFVNLPHPPEWVIAATKDEILNKNYSLDDRNLSPITALCEPAETLTINGTVFNYGEFYTHVLSSKLTEWFKQSLPLNIVPGGIIVTKGDLWPHQDFDAQWSLNYIIEPGGDNVETYWSKAEGMYLRPGYHSLSYWRKHTGLTEVHSYQLPARQWVIIPVDIVHGTKNQTSDRISLSVKIPDAKVKLLKKLYESTH